MNRWSNHFGTLVLTVAYVLGCAGKLSQDNASHSASEAHEMAAAGHDPGLDPESDPGRDAESAESQGSALGGPATSASGPPPTDNSAPWQLLDSLAQVSHLAIERDELFWILDGVGADGECVSDRELGGCNVEQCRQSARSFSLAPAPNAHLKRPMQVVDGVAYYASAGLGIRACPVNDCTSPRRLFGNVEIQDFVISGGTAYVMADVPLRCKVADCEATVERIRLRAPAGVESLKTGDGVVLYDGYLYLSDLGRRIVRVPADSDSSVFEVPVVSDSIGKFSVRNDRIYWVESLAPGRILSCPTSGCVGEPTVLAEGLAMPTHLLVDDAHVYFTEPRCDRYGFCDDPGFTRDRLSRCSISGCTSPTVLLENVGIGVGPNSSCFGGNPGPVMGTTHLYVVACDGSAQSEGAKLQLPALANQSCRIFAVAK